MQTPDNTNHVNRVIMACVIVLCLVSTALILAVPAESLMVDLVYQGF
jgi:hypothetical protein